MIQHAYSLLAIPRFVLSLLAVVVLFTLGTSLGFALVSIGSIPPHSPLPTNIETYIICALIPAANLVWVFYAIGRGVHFVLTSGYVGAYYFLFLYLAFLLAPPALIWLAIRVARQRR